MNCRAKLHLTCRLMFCIASALLLAGCGQRAGGTRAGTIPEWEPELDQAIEQLEEILASETQQQPMNYTSANLASVYDAKLYIVFQQSLAKAGEDERSALMRDQRAWLGKRWREMEKSAAKYEGGTLAGLVAAKASIRATRERIAWLTDAMRPSTGSPQKDRGGATTDRPPASSGSGTTPGGER